MTMQPDDVMIQVGEGIALSHSGNRLAARMLFAQLWERVGPDGDPFHRCAIAHSMADLQDELREELRWDLLACEAAGQLTDARVREGGVSGPVQVLFPSLHLNLADDYLRLEEFELASQHVMAGKETLSFLPDDGYASMIRGGLGRVEDAIIEHRSPGGLSTE
ncbi:MAG: hypothetical protein ACYC19_10285 [Acidimicrobiales bacterium]